MAKTFRKGAIGALLDEYEKVINELTFVIHDIREDELILIVDSETKDLNSRSAQAVLSHVIISGYKYCIYIRRLKEPDAHVPTVSPHFFVMNYIEDLGKVFDFTVETFNDLSDKEIDEFDESKQIITSWGQVYNIEQIMEHAIVHILRHRRQLEKFKNIFRKDL